MLEWKVEDLALMNKKFSIVIGDEKIYTCEYSESREDKIAFIDSIRSGKMSAIIDLIEKFKKDKPKLPKDKYGEVTYNALKKWINENDNYDQINFMINGDFFIGGFMGNIDTGFARNRSKTYTDFVDEVFHQTLKDLEREEIAYFKSTDKYCISTSSLREMMRKYHTTFGIDLIDYCGDIYIRGKDARSKRPLTIEEINILIDKYNQLQKYIDSIASEINITY